MIRTRLIPSTILFLLGAVTLSGCGGGMNSATVKGKVTVDGTPLTRGTVRFVPDTGKGNKATAEPTATIGSNGEYMLETNGKPGAPLGWFKVAVIAGDLPDSAKPLATKSDVAARFNNPDKSGLTVEVVATPADGAYDLRTTAK